MDKLTLSHGTVAHIQGSQAADSWEWSGSDPAPVTAPLQGLAHPDVVVNVCHNGEDHAPLAGPQGGSKLVQQTMHGQYHLVHDNGVVH